MSLKKYKTYNPDSMISRNSTPTQPTLCRFTEVTPYILTTLLISLHNSINFHGIWFYLFFYAGKQFLLKIATQVRNTIGPNCIYYY